MEQTSDAVLLGKLIDESSYEREEKGVKDFLQQVSSSEEGNLLLS